MNSRIAVFIALAVIAVVSLIAWDSNTAMAKCLEIQEYETCIRVHR